MKPAESSSVLSSQRHQDVILHSFLESRFHNRAPPCVAIGPTVTVHTSIFISRISLLKSVCCDFSIFSAVIPRSLALCLTWYIIRINSVVHSPPVGLIRDPITGRYTGTYPPAPVVHSDYTIYTNAMLQVATLHSINQWILWLHGSIPRFLSESSSAELLVPAILLTFIVLVL